MRVRYVKTLAKASSGMSLKAEHSGRVMMTLESSPRPPGQGRKREAWMSKERGKWVINTKVIHQGLT